MITSQVAVGHTFRTLGPTASLKGAPFTAIMNQGRWRHEGTVLGYIDEGKQFEDNAANFVFKREK